jgi:hypothetical protein
MNKKKIMNRLSTMLEEANIKSAPSRKEARKITKKAKIKLWNTDNKTLTIAMLFMSIVIALLAAATLMRPITVIINS